MADKKTDPKISGSDVTELRDEIDRLEAKIREAELAANAKFEQAAPLRTILTWKAPERVYTQRGRRWYVTVAFISVIIIAYAALTGNYLLILSLIALLSLMYAMNIIPPKIVEHEITNKGLKTMDRIYTWNKIEGFWVSEREGHKMLNVNLFDEGVSKMILLLDEKQAPQIVTEMVKWVDYINPGGTRQDIISRYTDGKHLPLTDFLDVYAAAGEAK
jgi:hypothetical protein